MRNIKPLALAAILIITLTLTPGASNASDPCRELHVGITLPLSGPGAAYGVAARNGFELARLSNPAAFRQITFHFEDSQLKPAEAVRAFNALRAQYSLWAHFDFGSATSLALAPIAEQAQLPFFSSAYDTHVSRSREYVMRFANSTRDYASQLISELRRREAKTLAIVVADNPFFTEYVDNLKALLLPDESITVYTVSPAEGDFRTIIAKLARTAEQYDGVGIFLFHEQSQQLLQRLRATRKIENVFGSDALEEAIDSSKANAMFKGAFFANAWVVPGFIDMYRGKYGSTEHHTFAAGTFDFANLLADAALMGGDCSREQLLTTVKSATTRFGALGAVQFSESSAAGGYFRSAITIKTING